VDGGFAFFLNKISTESTGYFMVKRVEGGISAYLSDVPFLIEEIYEAYSSRVARFQQPSRDRELS
jgi:hypothetical protein